jgi:hypothetical protein
LKSKTSCSLELPLQMGHKVVGATCILYKVGVRMEMLALLQKV